MPQREILWNIPDWLTVSLYAASAAGMLWIAVWFVRRALLWRLGSTADRPPQWTTGLGRLAAYLLTHRTIRRDRYAGLMHLLIFWGFVVLLIATTLVAVQHHFDIVFLTGTTYLVFSFAADLGGVAFCTGLAMALWRRRTEAAHGRLSLSRTTMWMLWLLMAIGVSGFLVEAARIAIDMPSFEIWSTVGFALAKLFATLGIHGETAVTAHRYLWGLHAVLVIAGMVAVPLTLLRHVLVSSFSVARPASRPGTLTQPAAPILGAVDLAQFRRLDLLQADACLTCGICTTVCPAEAAGKPLSPRSIVLGLREHLDHPNVPLDEQVEDDALWSCTTCNACDAVCPVDIDIVEKIVMLRRGRVAEAAIPDSAGDALESMAQKFNPFGQANSARMEWASGLDVPVSKEGEPVELLYWIGCGGAFDPAGREVSRAMIRILKHLNVNFRVLGCRERCTGDPARRLGEESLWQELAETNQRTIAGHSVKTILTHCPHCFSSFRNEYTDIGPMPTVIHHSQWLRDRIEDGSLTLEMNTNESLTFHDPCYLARVNDETAAPRAVIDGIFPNNRVEMTQHSRNNFCCGGGGGQMWLDVRGKTRVENIRAAHVEQTSAQTVATACPFCRVMLEAGRQSLGDGQGKWRVKDIAEIVVENLGNNP